MAKKQYYDISNILSTRAQYMLLLGQRANGKSYQCKWTVLENAFKNKRKFIYLRRWKQDIKQGNVTAYFDDIPISTLTHGKYSGVQAYQGSIYFTYLDEDDKLQRSEEIGRYLALNEAERYKSQAFVGYDYIIYEEFITDMVYLDDEPRKLQQLISTIARDKQMTVLMVGNTLSRVCPYFSEWSLTGVLKQRLGTIEVYHFHVNEDSVIDIAVEYCANSNTDNKMFFGQASKQIISGEWDTHDLPKLPRNKKIHYDKVYEVCVIYQAFKFIMELLVVPDTGDCIVYIYPLTSKRKVNRILQVDPTDNPMISSRLDPNKRPEQLILKAFMFNKVFYSDNLTGTDFRHVNEVFKIGQIQF